MRILLVDDDPMVRRTVAGLLQLAGHAWTEAADGLAALVALADYPADLIITDCQMPRMDGISFVRAVRAQHKDIPIVMVSGQDDLRIVQIALEAGVTQYLRKPLNPQMLFDILHQRSVGPSRLVG